MQAYIQDADFTLGNSLFGAVNLTENLDADKYEYSGYGIAFNPRGSFSLFDGSTFDKKVKTLGFDMSSYVHVYNKKRYFDS